MDLQGKPLGSTSQGLKNTSSGATSRESAGGVTSDSLAAESYNAGGGFAENVNAAPSGVKGASSTLNNTDTSAAETLAPSADRASRGEDGNAGSSEGPGGARYPEGAGGQPDFPGATNASGYSGGPSRGAGNQGSNSAADAAPGYAADVYLGDGGKPKGKDLTEDENMTGKRVTDFEVGGKNDPGRAALQGFENSNSAVSTGQSRPQREIDGENAYSELDRDERV